MTQIIGFCHDCKFITIEDICSNPSSQMNDKSVDQPNSRCQLQEEAQVTDVAFMNQLPQNVSVRVGEFAYTPAWVGDTFNGWIKRHKSYYPPNQWSAIKTM